MSNLEKALAEALSKQGREIAQAKELNLYRNLNPAALLHSAPGKSSRELIAPFLPYSKAQLAQDLFALAISNTSSPKFFVELGATDGVSPSNTWLLEKKLGRNGILAEPAKTWHASLSNNRSCIIDTRCVAKETGLEYTFLEAAKADKENPELSSIQQYANSGDRAPDIHLRESMEYAVKTISPGDLLDTHDAPKDIQLLSIDTESSELEIPKDFDFHKRTIHSICVEHNYVAQSRQQIYELLDASGYKRILRTLSKWDDWYILKES